MIFLTILGTYLISPSFADERAVPANLTLGAFSVWHEGSFYMGDLFTSGITRISDDGNRVYKGYINSTVPTPYVAPISDEKDRFIVTIYTNLVKVAWDGYTSEVTELETIFTGQPNMLLGNLVIARNGAIYFGTLSKSHCSPGPAVPVYKYTREQGFTVVDYSVGFYGAALDESRNQLYFESPCAGIYAYDRDPSTGDLSNRRLVYKYESVNGDAIITSGVTVTDSGMIITVLQNGGRVQLINPGTGEVISEYHLPTPGITASAFGGANGDVLIVGSGTVGYDYVSDVPLPSYPAPGGSAFMISGFAQGNPARLPLSDSFQTMI